MAATAGNALRERAMSDGLRMGAGTDQMSSESTPWIITGASTIITALASAVAFLFRLNETKSIKAVTALETRLDGYTKRVEALDVLNRECIVDRARLQATCEIFEKRLQQIEEIAIKKGLQQIQDKTKDQD
jgi:cytochrome c-type biogenesis protein CcmH/NrfG